jgi:hypothetical protein
MNDTDGPGAQRTHLHDAIARLPPLDDEIPDGAFLVGWVLVAEFADPDGSRWFVRRRGTDGGERDLMPWTEKGYLHEALDSWRAGDVADALDPRGDD